MRMIIAAALALAAGTAQAQRRQPPEPQAGVRLEMPGAPTPEFLAKKREEARKEVEALLGNIDTPIPLERWKKVGSHAAQFLEQTAQDRDALPSRRARALEGLSIVGSKNAPSLMVDLARDGETPLAVRIEAVRGAGRVLGSASLPNALKPVLEEATDPQLRAMAAEVIAETARDEGCPAVRAQAEKEKERGPRWEKALGRCAAATKQ